MMLPSIPYVRGSSVLSALLLITASLTRALPTTSSISAAALDEVSSSPGMPQQLERRADDCVTGLHIIIVRASNAPKNGGVLLNLTDKVIPRIPDSDAISVQYPATIENYPSSVSAGVGNTTRALVDYTIACPDTKIALVGFSQGAQVIGNTLVGDPWSGTPGVDTQYLKNIVAITLMGDPTFVLGQTFDRGTSTNNGEFARANTDLFTEYGLSDKMRSYCDFNDKYCAVGNSTVVHHSYVEKYGGNATHFIVSSFCSTCVDGSGDSSKARRRKGTATDPCAYCGYVL